MIGCYKECIIVSTLIIIHELGHFLCAKILKIETDKIYIYPLGGISKFNMPLNINWKLEFLVLIMGPLFQNIAYLILIFIFKNSYLVRAYHIGILKFNLLPIYPLDGGKLMNLLLNVILPYKKSLQVIILISYILTILMLFNSKSITINVIITYIFLLILIRKEELKISFQYNKFLLERYINDYYFKRKKIIKNSNNFYRFRENLIEENGIIYKEKEYLIRKYNNFFKKY